MNDNTYKIKLKNNKVLGPVSHQTIVDLIETKKISGSEKISQSPTFNNWKTIASVPEFAELLLSKLQDKKEPKLPNDNPIALETTPNPENEKEQEDHTIATRTQVLQESTVTFSKPESEEEYDREVPTLINIKHEVDPDIEKTQFIESKVPKVSQNQKTKMINVMAGAKREKNKGQQEEAIIKSLEVKPKRSTFSKITFLLLAAGLSISFYITKENTSKIDAALEELRPKNFNFKSRQIQVKMPGLLSKKIQSGKSAQYLNKGEALYYRDTPVSYIKAIKQLYRAVSHNTKNIVARSLLASSYIRVHDIIPRNEKLYRALKDLLDIKSRSAKQIPEYIAAKAEFLIFMQKLDTARKLLENATKKTARPILLYHLARIYDVEGEKNKAINFINRAISLTVDRKKDPRHLILLAKLLKSKGQKKGAEKVLISLLKKRPKHGMGLLTYADLLYSMGKNKKAFLVLKRVIDKPSRVDKINLGKAFLLMARILESQKKYQKAYKFAAASHKLIPSSIDANDLKLIILSKNPKTSRSYSKIVEGLQKERAKQFKKAINLYIRAREAKRDDPNPMYHLGRLYENQGKQKLAISYYKKAITGKKKVFDAYFKLANIYLQRYELNLAEQMLRMAFKVRKSTRVPYMKGRISLRKNDKLNARANFNNAILLGSRLPELYIKMGEIEGDRNDRELSAFYNTIALKYDPFNEIALYNIALSRFYTETPTSAIKFLQRKLYVQPNSSAIMTNLALIYLKSGDRVKGKQLLQKAISNNKAYARAFKLLGDTNREEGNNQGTYQEKRESYKFALASYDYYSKLVPNEPDGYVAAGDLYFFVRDFGNAARNYNTALNLAPNYPGVRLNLSKIARNGRENEKALNLINEEIKRHPNNSDAYVELGNIQLVSNKLLLASDSFAKAARIKNNNVEAIVGLAYVRHEQGHYESSIKLFQRAIKLRPLQADLYWKLGLSLEKNENIDKAIEAYKNFIGLTKSKNKTLASKALKKLRVLQGRRGR